MENKIKLLTALVCAVFWGLNFSSASAVDITSGTVNLDSDYNAEANQKSSTDSLILDANGHSINGNGFSGIKNTNTNLEEPIEIKNVGGYNLSETTETATNTVLKFDDEGNVVRYEINDSGSANGFANNSSTPVNKNYGSFISTRSGLTIENSVIKDNTSSVGNSSTYGGAITTYDAYAKDKELNILNSYITGNSINLEDNDTSGAYGGAVASYTRSTLSIINSYITNNSITALGSANVRGGAVHSEGSTVIDNTYFGNNSVNGKSVQGAAITMTNGIAGFTHEITNSIFENNTAQGVTGLSGGTAYLSGDVTIKNSLFTGNKSIVTDGSNMAYGGVLYHYGSNGDLEVSDTTFENNSIVCNEIVRQYGGTVFTNGSNAAFNNVKFINNSAENTRTKTDESYVHGGAIYMYGKSGEANTLTIENSLFDNNSTKGTQFTYGGAIAGENGTNRYINISNSTFKNNSAASTNENRSGAMGGAIYNANNNILNIENSTFENNTSISAAQNGIRRMGGGAVYNETNGITTIVDTSFKDNKESVQQIKIQRH